MAEENGTARFREKLFYATVGALLTLGSTYLTQYFAFLKDSPSRAEVATDIEKSRATMATELERAMKSTPYAVDRPTLALQLTNLGDGMRELKDAMNRLETGQNEIVVRITKIEAVK